MTFEQRIFLVVDNSPNDLVLIESALLRAGLTNPIVCKLSVEEACKYLNGGAINPAQRPSVLMTDLKMPGMDGIDLVRWVKNQRGLEDMLVVMLSGSTLDGDATRSYEVG